jgi:protein-S-isoprenylcysteine O-methyltransferase Ste14
MMFNDPLGWFPGQLFNDTFTILFFLVFTVDNIVPRLIGAGKTKPAASSDRGSYLLINASVVVAFGVGVYLRIKDIGTLSGFFQWLGLLLIVAGSAFREWALIKLGRYFSRTVQIASGHKVIQDGPYKWIRHPAYTGMILTDVGFVMGIGSWLGALLTLIIMTLSTLYRIGVEEKVLADALGEEYGGYRKRTWKLFPGW